MCPRIVVRRSNPLIQLLDNVIVDILAATKYPRRLGRSRQNSVATTESPSDKINCDTGPKFIHILYVASMECIN